MGSATPPWKIRIPAISIRTGRSRIPFSQDTCRSPATETAASFIRSPIGPVCYIKNNYRSFADPIASTVALLVANGSFAATVLINFWARPGPAQNSSSACSGCRARPAQISAAGGSDDVAVMVDERTAQERALHAAGKFLALERRISLLGL